MPLVTRLRALGLHGLVASVLDAGPGPLTYLGAQVLYALAPVAQVFTEADTATALAHVLEDPTAMQSLAQQLTEAGETW
ncbi:MAG: hypothetical protein JNL09_00825 [Anaerolineales bacterium]|nr:hypothetical protein [Anaerolineales bacterium]